MSKRAYATLSAIALVGAILVAMVGLLAYLTDAKLAFAGMAFTALLGLAGTLAGRGTEPVGVDLADDDTMAGTLTSGANG